MAQRKSMTLAIVCVLVTLLLAGIVPAGATSDLYDWVEKTDWLVNGSAAGDDRILDVAIADVDDDGTDEIVLLGYATPDGTDRDAYVGIYHLSGTTLVKETEYTKDFNGSDDAFQGMAVLDYDSDQTTEILVAGYATHAVSTASQEDIIVGILSLSGGSVTPEVDWYKKDFPGSAADRNWGLDIAVGNVDADASQELVVVSRDDFGAYVNTPMRVGVLGVSGGTIVEETPWFSEDPTSVLDYWTDVEIVDLDGDATNEIVVVGSYGVYWSSIAAAAYRVTGGAVVRESDIYKVRVGYQNNHAGDLAIADVDGDGHLEVVVAGNFDDAQSNSDGGDMALGVLDYDGSQFTPAVPWLHLPMGKPCASVAYSESDYLTSVAVGDVDGDTTDEIVVHGHATGACTKYDMLVAAFGLDGGALSQESEWYWKDSGSQDDIGGSIAVADLDSDGVGDIALGGYRRVDASSTGDRAAVVLGSRQLPVRGRVTVPATIQVTKRTLPLKNVVVTLVPSSGGILQTTTDDDGYYAFDFEPQASVTYYVNVELRHSLWYAEDAYFLVYYESVDSENLCSVSSASFTPVAGRTERVDLAFDDETLGGYPSSSDDRQKLAVTYHYVKQVFDFITDDLGVTPDYMLPVEVVGLSSGNCPVAGRNCYMFKDKPQVHIDGVWYSSTGWPDNSEWHETFHHLMQDTITIPAIDPSESCNHCGYENPDTQDSWAEGWATFWPLVLADQLPIEERPYPDPSTYNGASLEVNWKAWYAQTGDNREDVQREDRAVASLLWDLYDSNADCGNLIGLYPDYEFCDDIDLELSELWYLLSHTTTNNQLRDFEDVYRALSDASVGQADADVDGIDNLDELFILHGFFVDSDSDYIYDSGEEIGRAADGARPDRQNAPPVPGAYLKVNFEDADGNPESDNMLRIEVSFPPPGEGFGYAYEVAVPDASGSLIYVELPPEVHDTTLRVHAGRSFADKDLVMDSDDYWSAVQTSETGYFLEHTFEIQHPIYLPLIQKP